MKNSTEKQSAELKKAKKTRTQSEKRIAELDRLFTRLYEDNVSGKISDERFEMMSANYEDEQKRLKIAVSELTAFIDSAEQKSADVTAFLSIVRKYEHITAITPEIMHESRKFGIKASCKNSITSCKRQEIAKFHLLFSLVFSLCFCLRGLFLIF